MNLAWLPCALTMLLLSADMVMAATPLRVAAAAALAVIAVVGAVVASRLPSNPTGWLLAVIAVGFAGTVTAADAYDETPSALFAWLSSWLWVPAMTSIAAFPLLFPTGRPPTPRWRPLLWAIAAALPLLLVGTAFAPGQIEDYPGVENPFGVESVIVFGWLGFALVVAVVVGSIAALIVRFRRSHGVERQQLKWVTAAAALFPVAFAAPVDGDAGFALILVGAMVIALAVGVAMLRYRLYDVDVVINRALVYFSLTGALAATYSGSVLVLQLVLPARSDFAVALSTLAVAAAFGPARTRIQAIVDRRFFRSRYDAQRTLVAFGAQVRGDVSLDALEADLRTAVEDTLRPAHVSVWVRG